MRGMGRVVVKDVEGGREGKICFGPGWWPEPLLKVARRETRVTLTS
jgi:hypothetical protein